MNDIAISIVLPSYLEEENLRFLLPRINETLARIGKTYEVIVVDTISPLDETKQVCTQNNARYLNRSPSNAFGDAVRTGIAAARGERVVFMDADGSHTPEFIATLEASSKDYDVVIASRYIEGGFTDNSWALIAMSRFLNITYSFILNLNCKDVSNSFKIYKREQLLPIDLKCQNFDIVEEILYKLNKMNPGLKILELPYTFKQRAFGKTKRNLLVFMLTYLKTIIQLRLN
ncbi:MAG: glycosyltransferase [Armatimonadota bacterium]